MQVKSSVSSHVGGSAGAGYFPISKEEEVVLASEALTYHFVPISLCKSMLLYAYSF